MDRRIPHTFGSTLLLAGAFAVGGVLHASFVEGSIAPTSPLAVFGILLGAGLIYVGKRVEDRFDPSELVPEDEDDEEEFDESMSPISTEDLAERDRDESYEQ